MNLYSTNEFCKITEISDASPTQVVISGKSCQYPMFGIERYKRATFGIYAPFWLPSVLNCSDIDEMNYILQEFILKLIKNGIVGIDIRLPPAFYSRNLAVFEYLLVENGFKIIKNDLWQSINIKKFEDSLNYEKSLKHSSKKVIKRFRESYTYEFHELDIKNDVSVLAAYELINKNRAKLGSQLKYSFDYLKKMIQINSKNVRLFELIVSGVSVASAICHLTAEDTMYVAAWGDAEHDLEYSPMYIFALELVAYGKLNKLNRLDFGISNSFDNKNFGLFNFKKNIGCEATIQRTFSYSINEKTI